MSRIEDDIDIIRTDLAELRADHEELRADFENHLANIFDAHRIDNKLVWAGLWAPGVYKRNDMVTDSGWQTVAKVETWQRPVTDAGWLIPTVPPWVSTSEPGPLVMGARFTVAAITAIQRLRAWVTVAGTLSLVVDPLGPTPVRQDFPVTGTGWVEVEFPDIVLPSGVTIDLFLSIPSNPAPQDVIVDGWPTQKGFAQVGVYDPTTVVLTRDQYGVDVRNSVFGSDWDLVSWPSCCPQT
jgi:hypothetical protein